MSRMTTVHTNKMRGLVEELLNTINGQEKAIKDQQKYIVELQEERNSLITQIDTLMKDMEEFKRNRESREQLFVSEQPSVSPVPEMDEVDSQQKGPSQESVTSNRTTENGGLDITEENQSVNYKKVSQLSTVEEEYTTKKLSRSKTDSELLKDSRPTKPHSKSREYPQIPPKPILSSRSATMSVTDSSSSDTTASPTSPKTWPTSPASPVSPLNFEAPKSAGNAQKSRTFIGALRSISPSSPSQSKSPSSPSRSKSPAKKSGTIKVSRSVEQDNEAPMRNTRSATMSSQQAYHEHHMNKQRRNKKTSHDKVTRRLSTSNLKRTTGSNIDSGSKFGYQFSPDMEERLQMKIEQGIEKSYGSIERCIHAASVIQRYYRQWKMKQRFKTLRKEIASASAIRPRAASVKTPMRSRSIRYQNTPSAHAVSILDEFPEIKMLTTRIQSRSKALCHPLQNKTIQDNDVGPTAQLLHKEVSLEVQETSMVIVDRSTTPSSDVDVVEDNNDEVFTPTLLSSPEIVLSDTSSELGSQLQPPCVPLSISADYLTGRIIDDKEQPRPHSVSIVSHFARSRSVENLMGIDNRTGELKKPVLKPHESATSLKKKTNIGITLFNRKPAKGILYMVLQGILQDSSEDVAHFLKTQYGLSKIMIGKFFSDLHNEFSMSVLEALVNGMNFADKPIDEALRCLQEAFQITGEAQLIERIVSIFAGKYFNDNASGAVASEDAAFVLSYAIMMLNTDLHSPQVRHHMTTNEWIKMNKGNNNGENFPKGFLTQIYERMQKEPFRPGPDHVSEIESLQKGITGTDCPNLVMPHRQLRLRVTVNEIAERSPLVFSNHHVRVLFVFNDMLLVCKPSGAKKQNPTYSYRSCFSLLNTVCIQCDSLKKYKHGVQLISTLDNKKLITCSCDNVANQTQLLKKLNESIQEINELEKLRIATQSQQGNRRPSISSKERQTSRKVSGPITIATEEHELSSDAMVISRSNTLVKSGSFHALSDIAESDSLSDCTIASSPGPRSPLSSSASVDGGGGSFDSHHFSPIGRQPHRSKTPPKSQRYSVNHNPVEKSDSSSPSSSNSLKPFVTGSPKTGTGFLRKLKGKSAAYSVNS